MKKITGGIWAVVVTILATSVHMSANNSTLGVKPESFECAEVVRALHDVMVNDLRLRDWAQIGRYREDNQRFACSGTGGPRVIFYGDSVTEEWSNPAYGAFFPGRSYLNRGIGGQTTSQLLLRFRSDVVALRPDVVVILGGINDIAGMTGPMTDEEITGNLESMCEIASAQNIRVVLSSILPVSSYHFRADRWPHVPRTARHPPQRIHRLNAWMKDYALRKGYVYLDYWPVTADSSGMLKSEFSEDDIHPNAKGYAAMVPQVEAAIKAALDRLTRKSRDS